MFSGQHPRDYAPYVGKKRIEIGVALEAGQRLPVDDSWPGWLKALLHDCWHSDPTARPSFYDIARQLVTTSDEVTHLDVVYCIQLGEINRLNNRCLTAALHTMVCVIAQTQYLIMLQPFTVASVAFVCNRGNSVALVVSELLQLLDSNSMYKLLSQACQTGCVEAASMILDHYPAFLNGSDSGRPPLFHAYRYDQHMMAKYLVQRGADIMQVKPSPLHLSISTSRSIINSVEFAIHELHAEDVVSDSVRGEELWKTVRYIFVKKAMRGQRLQLVFLVASGDKQTWVVSEWFAVPGESISSAKFPYTTLSATFLSLMLGVSFF